MTVVLPVTELSCGDRDFISVHKAENILLQMFANT